MKHQKEVLIQDVSAQEEIKRLNENLLYRRDETYGSPLYFAPYFTRKSGLSEGISQLSKVLGVLTIQPSTIHSFVDQLQSFAKAAKASDGRNLVDAWLGGFDKGATQSPEEKLTIFFLAAPVRLKRPLLKDPGIEEGRGKDWIAGKIPKNRCVSFAEFCDHMVKAEADPRLLGV